MTNDIDVKLPVTVKFRNGRREQLKGFSGNGSGTTYDVLLQIGEGDFAVGRFEFADDAIYDGFRGFFIEAVTQRADENGVHFVPGDTIADASVSLLRALCFKVDDGD